MEQMSVRIEESIEKMAKLNRQMVHLFEYFYQTLPLVEEDLKMATQELQILIEYFLNSNSADSNSQQISSVVDQIFVNLTENLDQYQDNQVLMQYVTNLYPNQGVKSYQYQIQRQLRHVSEILQGVLANIDTALSPVQAIMERVQVQDLYQQTLEKIMEMLTVLKSEYAVSEFRNDPVFYLQSVRLAHQTFLQNQEKMQRSLEGLAGDFTQISETVQSVLQDSVYIRYFLIGEKEGEPVLQKILGQIDQVVQLFEQLAVNPQQKMVATEVDQRSLAETGSWVPRIKRQLMVVEQFLSEAIRSITYSIQKLHIEVESIFEHLKGSDHAEVAKEIEQDLAKLTTDVSQILQGTEEVTTRFGSKEQLEAIIAKLQSSLRWKLALDGKMGREQEQGSDGGELTLF